MAGFYNHIWYKLLSEEGVPLSGASIWLYDYSNPTVQLLTYNASGGALTQPLITDNNGVFDFYVRDHILDINFGYEWDTQFIISWSKDDKSGVIRGDHLFGEYESVSLSGNTARRNKAISNYLGYKWNQHVDFLFGDVPGCGSSSSSSSSTSSSSSSSNSSSSSSESASASPIALYSRFPCNDGSGGFVVDIEGGDPLNMQDGPEADAQWWDGSTAPSPPEGTYALDSGGGHDLSWGDPTHWRSFSDDYETWISQTNKSISFWIAPGDGQPANLQVLLGIAAGLTANDDYWYFYLQGDGRIGYSFRWNNQFYQLNGQTTSPVFANGLISSFSHIAITFSISNLIIYADTVEVGNQVITGTDFSMWDANSQLLEVCRLGGADILSPNDDYTFKGLHDDWRFYNGTLSSGDVSNIYNGII